MRTAIRSLIATIVLVAASTALAEEESKTDVSQINGQLVPVGDHNQYHYSFRRWNVSANPVGWMLGFYGASLSYGFHDNIALRLDANYFAPPDSDSTGYEFGMGLPIYFRRTYQGAFLEPGLIVRHLGNSDASMSSTVFGPQALVGWHWSWDSGLNIAVAIGAGRNISSDADQDGHIFANGYLRFGYSF